MINGKFDPLDKMFSIQSFDTSTNTFAGYLDGDKHTYLGAMWISEPLTGLDEGNLLSIQAILSSPFPAGTIIQMGLLSSPDIEETVLDYLGKKDRSRNTVLNELISRQANLMRSGVNKPIITASGVCLCRKRVILTLKCQFEGVVTGNLTQFNEIATKVESSLRANGLPIMRSNANDYLMICRLITHIYDKPDRRYDDSLAMNEQVFYAGDEVIVHKDHIQFNTGSTKDKGFFMSALSPKFLPNEFSLGLMNYAIGDPKGLNNQIRLPYFMVISMHYPDQIKKTADIKNKANWISHQLFGGSMAKFMPTLVLKKEGFDILQHEIETKSAVLVETTFTLWLYGKTLRESATLSDDVRTYWSSLGFDMRSDKIILDALLTQALPMNASQQASAGLFRSHTMTSSQASQFLPIIAEWRGSPNPSVLLSTRRGEVGGFDLFKSSMNFNAVLVAASGSGKSFVTQRFITDYLAEGAKIWVIDSGRSYQKLAAAVGGTFMEFKPTSDICLNPFTSFLEERGGAGKLIDDEMDLLASLIERMAAQRDPLDDLEMETLKKAIRQTFIESQGHTTVQDISDWLAAQAGDPRAKDLSLRLDSFAYGQYSKFFNDHANVNMSADFVVLELDDLKNQKQLQQVVLLQLVAQITNEMYLTSGRKKILIIDEGWELLDDPVMSKAMEAAYRKARKNDGAIITVTQGISDLYKSRSGQSMIENATWQIILQQKVEAIDSVYNAGQLTLDPYSYQMLKTLNTVPGSHSELMIVGNGSTGIFRLTVDKFTQVMYSTSGAERTKVLDDIDNGVDVIESIQSLMVGDESFKRLNDLKVMVGQLLQNGRNKQELHRMLIQSVNDIALNHIDMK